MSQQYDRSVPPPPPPFSSTSSVAGAGAVATPYGSTSAGSTRSRPVSGVFQSSFVNSNLSVRGSPVLTTINGPYFPPGTPLQYSPHTPSGLNPNCQIQAGSPRSPVMEPYNPRQWTGRGQVSGSQMVFQARSSGGSRDVTGMEASMPSPPPPYSPATPDHAHRPAAVLSMGEPTGTPVTQSMHETVARNSPQIPMSPAFPPPPGASSRHRDRSLSGLGGQRGFFNLSNLRGKQPMNAETQLAQVGNAGPSQSFAEPRPPAARRAASAGHIGPHTPMVVATSSSNGSAGRGSPDVRWQPGMPLPPPPPGPPPAGARSQSLNRTPGQSMNVTRDLEVPRPHRAAASPNLGPIPPTPADWTDQEQDSNTQQSQSRQPLVDVQAQSSDLDNTQPLHIDTGAQQRSPLTRRPARRENSTQGIRERRSQSRAAKDSVDLTPDSVEDRPRNLVFSTVGGSISRRREHNRTASGIAGPSSASGTVGRFVGVVNTKESIPPSETVLTPPYTPAVGNQVEDGARRQGSRLPSNAAGDRPISHLLHTPNDELATMPAPLSPARPPSSSSMKTPAKFDTFALQGIERHRSFVEKEAAASSDEERLELFANYIVNESRLRRDKYSTAYAAMAGEIVDLTRDMWRSYTRNSRRAQTPNTSMSSSDPTIPSWASDSQPTSAQGNLPSSASSYGDFTPTTDVGSNGDNADGYERPEGRQWAEAFKPSLSPIPSMAVSTVPDEDSSRGRTASRWWEQSHSGSGSIGKPDRMEKSRRETKYMGVSAASLASTGDGSNPTRGEATPAASSQDPTYGLDEYPPEKVGWHEPADFDTPLPTPHRQGERKPTTPGVVPMDISRLVTLPPPYPRHHPALSNSHPRLADLRSEHRFLAQSDDIQQIKDKYLDQDFRLQKDQQDAAKQRRTRRRNDIQNKVADGRMSFADAAKAEAEFDAEEAERGKQDARASFALFETEVAHPLNTLLTDRLQRADNCIKTLCNDMNNGINASNPNQAQEEGDEHPERLEKLTLLKWIFEAREQLHKEMFDLHASRSEKYSEVILTPYRIAKAQDKIDEASAFFKKDSTDRQIGFAKDSLKRLERLQGIMDNNVSRGVEDQLSAFWDIAPALLQVIQHIPSRMSNFEIQVPAAEYDENPSYHDHPLQYLYSLLGHAEKSAYQLIESQTNLLCLLHEVRTATTKANLGLIELERDAAAASSSSSSSSSTSHRNGGGAGDQAEIHAEMDQARKEAENHLTRDLKEKVEEVERQWTQALGGQLQECKGRVRAWLDASGGLEDELDD